MIRFQHVASGLAIAAVSVVALCSPALAATGTTKPTLLGSAAYRFHGKGWGTAHPTTLDNGGDPSGIVAKIAWKNWGSSVSYGTGRSFIFRPQGGYYPKSVTVALKAQSLGKCSPKGSEAYTQLYVREPSKPGGALGKWFLWSGSETLCEAA